VRQPSDAADDRSYQKARVLKRDTRLCQHSPQVSLGKGPTRIRGGIAKVSILGNTGGRRWRMIAIVPIAILVVIGTGGMPARAAGFGQAASSYVTNSAEALPGSTAWRAVASYVAPPDSIAIACPSSSVCYSAGENSSRFGSILESSDGGADWTSQSVPSGTGYLSAIACPSTVECFAVGDASTSEPEILATFDSGLTWMAQPAAGEGPAGIACPSTTSCYVVELGGEILSTGNSGLTWTSQTVASVTSLNGIACPSASSCYAVGQSTVGNGSIVMTSDAGSTWTNDALPTGTGLLDAIACPSTTQCVAVGEQGTTETGEALSTTDSGSSWTALAGPMDTLTLRGISCPSITTCYSVDFNGNLFSTSDAGASWDTGTRTDSMTSITCMSDTQCVASSSNNFLLNMGILSTVNSGTTWTPDALPEGTTGPKAIVCPSQTECMAIGRDSTIGGIVFISSDSGVDWTERVLPNNAPNLQLTGIACPSSLICYISGMEDYPDFSSFVFKTTNGGNTWGQSAVNIAPIGIACPSTSNCFMASVYGLASSTDSGANWTYQNFPLDMVDVSAIACPTLTSCFVAGANAQINGFVAQTSNAGATWRIDALPSGAESFASITCLSATACLAAGQSQNNVGGGDILRTTDGGLRWTWSGRAFGKDVLPSTINSVACTSTSVCYAVGLGSQDQTDSYGGGLILVSTNGGKSWTPETIPSGTRELNGVACLTVSDCIAVGAGPDTIGALFIQGFFPPQPLTIATSSLPGGQVGIAYSASLTATGGNPSYSYVSPPYSWSLVKRSGDLPKGLQLNKSTGAITGTPIAAGTFSFKVEVLDTKTGKPATQNSATSVLTIVVSA
jgi:hypothetical protein